MKLILIIFTLPLFLVACGSDTVVNNVVTPSNDTVIIATFDSLHVYNNFFEDSTEFSGSVNFDTLRVSFSYQSTNVITSNISFGNWSKHYDSTGTVYNETFNLQFTPLNSFRYDCRLTVSDFHNTDFHAYLKNIKLYYIKP